MNNEKLKQIFEVTEPDAIEKENGIVKLWYYKKTCNIFVKSKIDPFESNGWCYVRFNKNSA